MKRIYVPTKTGSDWQCLLAKPELHWKKGASAMTAAVSWESAANAVPKEITLVLDSTRDPLLLDQKLLIAIPEWQVPLPGGSTNSSTDILAICRNDETLCILGVEAKVLEDFGPLVGEKRKQPSPGQVERMKYLHALLGVEHFEDSIRYQLLHRTASAILTAREFHARAAVMVIQAFETPEEKHLDFLAFVKAMKAREVAPNVFKVDSFGQPVLYLAWCDGDKKFRDVELPSAI